MKERAINLINMLCTDGAISEEEAQILEKLLIPQLEECIIANYKTVVFNKAPEQEVVELKDITKDKLYIFRGARGWYKVQEVPESGNKFVGMSLNSSQRTYNGLDLTSGLTNTIAQLIKDGQQVLQFDSLKQMVKYLDSII
jgi:hypothetical protein